MKQTDFKAIEDDKIGIYDAKQRDALMLFPRMGPASAVVAALFEAEGIRAEALPTPTKETLAIGRRHTSGKECVPMTITTGSFLERLEKDKDSDEQFAFFIPTASGPCRFGIYNLLHKIILERTGWKNRVRIVSPSSTDYFAEMTPDFRVRSITGIVASDLLLSALLDVRPQENVTGQANRIYRRFYDELLGLIAESGRGTLIPALYELSGDMFGVLDLLERAAREFRDAKDFTRELPTVSMVGEIYARHDPFANDYLIDKLEARGIRVLLAPIGEWLEYMTAYKKQRIREDMRRDGDHRLSAGFASIVETGVIDRLYRVFSTRLGWGKRTRVADSLKAVKPYLNPELVGEAVLTLGGPIHEHEHGIIDGVVSIGPLECMPNKISEEQFSHVGEDKELISLTISSNGEPIDPEIIDRFVFEVKERFAKRGTVGSNGKIPVRSNMEAYVRQLRGNLVLNSFRVLAPFNHRPLMRPENDGHTAGI